MNYTSRLISILFLALSIALPGGCTNPARNPAGGRTAEFPPHIRIYYTGSTQGTLFPCGCRIPMGGLSRRAGVINADRAYPQLVVDAGSFSYASTNYGKFQTDWALKGMKEIGYVAVNLGVQETIFSANQLREWDASYGPMFVSANLQDNLGHPITRTYITTEIAGIKFGITGVVTESGRPPDATELPVMVDPIEPLRSVIAEMKENWVDFIILLADAQQAQIDLLTAEFPEIDLVVSAQGFSANTAVIARTTGSALAVVMGDQGKYLGRIRLDFDPDGTITNNEVERIALDSTSPTLSSMSNLLMDFKMELRERREDFISDPGNPFQSRTGAEFRDILTGYAGGSFCQECHGAVGMEQRTFHGIASVVLQGDEKNNPECLACHTTGYGIPTGFNIPDVDTHMNNIQCEACHGPAADHVREQTVIAEGLDPAYQLESENALDTPFSKEVPQEVCLRCHTEEWSPDFDYATWVVRVNHSDVESMRWINNEEQGTEVTRDTAE